MLTMELTRKMKRHLTPSKETLVYVALWAVLFVAPVVMAYFRATTDGQAFSWSEVLGAWGLLGVFLAIFIVHDLVLAPLLIVKQRRLAYCLSVVVLATVFMLCECALRPGDKAMGPRPSDEPQMVGQRPPEPPGHRAAPPQKPAEGHEPSVGHEPTAGRKPMAPPSQRKPPMRQQPPLIIGQVDVVELVMLIGLLAVNLVVKLYFKNQSDRREMEELERRNLSQQIAYLKYQINPHFLMNTLNNIHALVDIDPEKAKQSIVELSKMMRYVLYDGDKAMITLQKEVAFIHNYLKLMGLRYADNLSVEADIPDNLPPAQLPPLLLITFIENAFKHGVSATEPSFIRIVMDADDGHLLFQCRNSKHAADPTMPREGGVGLRNVGQRLKLIYGDDYRLDIHETEATYSVSLDLPLSPKPRDKAEREHTTENTNVT